MPLPGYHNLSPDSNNITIEYSKIDFSKTTHSTVVYKKNNKPWEKAYGNSLNFEDMGPGEHHIKLGLVFEQNELPEKIEEIKFFIRQKFYQTIGAKIIVALVLLSVLFFAINYYISQKNVKVLGQQVKKRTQQLSLKMQELDEANNLLKTKNKNLSSYTYLVSHDLKAPLYNISSFLNIISERNKSKFDEKDIEYLGNVNYSLESMLSKINDLLCYSKISSNINLSNVEPINLNDIINEVKKDFKYEIEKKSIQFIVESELPKIKLEKISAHLLFQNLISNSIKYSRLKHPFIKINSDKNSEHITILVKDNGIGIKESYQPEAFDIFSRGQNNQSYEGTGIGLAICKKIVEAHNGSIELNSEENVGTVLSLIFPKVN